MDTVNTPDSEALVLDPPSLLAGLPQEAGRRGKCILGRLYEGAATAADFERFLALKDPDVICAVRQLAIDESFSHSNQALAALAKNGDMTAALLYEKAKQREAESAQRVRQALPVVRCGIERCCCGEH